MKRLRKYLVLLIALMLCGAVSVYAAGNPKHPAKESVSSVLTKYQVVQNKYNIAKTQWYDAYEKGWVAKAPQALALLQKADALINSGKYVQADRLLERTDKLLNQYDKSALSKFNVPTPLKDQDYSKIRRATVADYQMLERYGVKLWDYSTVFWGKGDDGNWYGGVAAISFHGTGQPVSPAIFNIYSSAEPQNPNRLFFNCIPQMTKTSDSISYSAIDGEKSLTYTVKKVDGATLVSVDAKGPGIDVHVELTPQMTYWYGQNTGVDMIFPDSPSAGFEEPSESMANITIRGQKANMKNGAGNSECWYNSAILNMKEKFVDWRTNLAKYGNEMWIVLHSDQVQGLFYISDKYHDAGLSINGKYVIPTEYHFTPIIANRSFLLTAKTSEGDLITTFDLNAGYDPFLVEFWGSLEGSIGGQPLTGGLGWLEKNLKGGPNALAGEAAAAKSGSAK
ncbi:MAG: hypothetical protein WCR46_09565 [Deltaproteobacteria bacterium]|jgi:hypothetical protein